MPEKRKCDDCGKIVDVVYDTKFKYINWWGYLCKDCFDRSSILPKESDMVTELTLKKEMPEKQNRIVKAVLECDPEEAMMDSVIELSCPECGTCRGVEPDACYTFICEGCGVQVKADVLDLCVEAMS